MNNRQKLLALISAMALSGTAISAQAAIIHSDVASSADAQAFEQIIASGNAQDFQKFLQVYPTSNLAPHALNKLLVLAKASEQGVLSRGDNGQQGRSNANEHGRQSPSHANPDHADDRALDGGIY